MKILAIETSCDETGIALVEGKKTENGFVFTTIKDALLSQAHLHAPYGGVYPNLAKREHEKNLPVLYEQFKNDEFDAIAVTHGPGLEPALWQGIEFAKKIAKERNLPLFGVNHMESHLISSLAQTQGQTLNQDSQGLTFELKNVKLPALALLVSGGHTEFVLMREWFNYEVIGQTLDDAVGECFDKVARMLKLPYPGGPEISKLADEARNAARKTAGSGYGDFAAAKSPEVASSSLGEPTPPAVSSPLRLPRPMLQSGTCDVSFSGLKTAALYMLREHAKGTPSKAKESPLTEEEKAAYAAEFEDAVADVFVSKTKRALNETGAQTFVIGGGVAANRYLRERLQQLVLENYPDVEFRLPELAITGDNAVMIAQCALTHLLSGDWSLLRLDLDIRAIGNLSIAG